MSRLILSLGAAAAAILLLSGCGPVTTNVPVVFDVPKAGMVDAGKTAVSVPPAIDERDIRSVQVTLGRNTWVAQSAEKPDETMRAAVQEALSRRGYATNIDATGARRLNVRVKQFALGHEMGMWAMTFHANISCAIDYTIDGKTGTLTVRGVGKNVCQRISAANMELAMQRALADFLQNFDREISATGL